MLRKNYICIVTIFFILIATNFIFSQTLIYEDPGHYRPGENVGPIEFRYIGPPDMTDFTLTVKAKRDIITGMNKMGNSSVNVLIQVWLEGKGEVMRQEMAFPFPGIEYSTNLSIPTYRFGGNYSVNIIIPQNFHDALYAIKVYVNPDYLVD